MFQSDIQIERLSVALNVKMNRVADKGASA